MRVIMFKMQFVPLVMAWRKLQTIRRTAWCKPGDTLSLRHWTSTAYRSKHKLIRTVTCTAVHEVNVTPAGIQVDGENVPSDRFARADGFYDWQEMRQWFECTHGLPFTGDLIKWQKPRRNHEETES